MSGEERIVWRWESPPADEVAAWRAKLPPVEEWPWVPDLFHGMVQKPPIPGPVGKLVRL